MTAIAEASAPKVHIPLLRFRLRTLLLFVVAMSIASAARRWATFASACAIASTTAIALAGAMVLAIYAPHSTRPFWVGFVFVGGGYLFAMLFFGQGATAPFRSINLDRSDYRSAFSD